MEIIKNLSFKYILLPFFITMHFISTSAYSKDIEIVSPNEKIRVVIRVSDQEKESIKEVLFKVELRSENKYVEMIGWSPLGIRTSIGNFVKSMQYVSSSKSIDLEEEYEMPFGKKRIYKNEATTRTIQFINSSGNELTLNFRAYNDGVAFRYEIEETSGKSKSIHILDEASQYSIVTPTNAWLQNYKIDYEEFYDNKLLDDSILEARFAYPALFEINNNAYMLITEANLGRESVASSLTFQRGSNKYKVTYPKTRGNFPNVGIVANSSWDSPWRIMIVGSLADIVQSTLVTDLSEPSKIKNDDWIIAGAASWVYWANNHGSKDYKSLKNYVDLAVEMNWPYTLIDWEWDAMENGGSIEDIVRYSVSKGIKPWMWYNSGTSWLDPAPVDHMVDPKKRKKLLLGLMK